MKTFAIVSFLLIGAAFADVVPAKLPEQFLKKLYNIQPRVVNGNDAIPKQFPYQVGISTRRGDAFYWCGGSVISESWVLTAAHCVVGDIHSLNLIFGATNRLDTYQVGQARQNISRFEEGQVIVHPLYNPSVILNDVALVRLPQKLEFSEYIQPIRLASSNSFQTFSNSPAVISGWGKVANNGSVVQHLQYGYVTILDLNACKSSYNPGLVTQGNICLDVKKSGVSSCGGDSGGPLVSTVTGELIGVTSFGSAAGCEHGAPAGYSSVVYFRDWIKYHRQTPSVGAVKHLRAHGSLLYKRSTTQHLALVSVKDDVKEIPYERVNEAFGVENHPHLLHALEEGEPVLRCRVLKALASVLQLPQELVVSMKNGVLELVEGGITIGISNEGGTSELSESEMELQELSAQVLSVMAQSPCGQSELLKGDTISRIKPVFASASNKRTCQHLYDALLCLSGSFPGARQLTSAGYLPVVLDHLKSCRSNDALRVRALNLLKNLINDGVGGTTLRALELGAVPQCAKRLHSPNFEVRAAACETLAAMGFVDKARKTVVEHGGIVPRLCALLTDSQWQVATASTGALMSLAAHDEIKRQIVANEGLASVNQLLQANKVPLQLHTTKLIAVVTALPAARKLLDVPATTLRLKTLMLDENTLLAKSAKVALAAVQWSA